MSKRYLIKDSHLKYFRKRVKFWQNVLGLLEVEFECVLKEHKEPGCRAEYSRYSKNGFIEIKLSGHWDRYPSTVELDKTAFHEVLESGYFSELRAMARGTYCSYEVEFHTHTAIRRAENTIFHSLRKCAT